MCTHRAGRFPALLWISCRSVSPQTPRPPVAGEGNAEAVSSFRSLLQPYASVKGVILFSRRIDRGAINSVAGGGSFISFPAFCSSGSRPVNANATNTVALWPGQPASVWAYRQELSKIAARTVIPLTVTGIIGGIAGAYVLLITPQTNLYAAGAVAAADGHADLHPSGRITRWVRLRARTPHDESLRPAASCCSFSLPSTSDTSVPAPASSFWPCWRCWAWTTSTP